MNLREDICDTIIAELGITRDEKGKGSFSKRELESLLAWIRIQKEKAKACEDKVEALQMRIKSVLGSEE